MPTTKLEHKKYKSSQMALQTLNLVHYRKSKCFIFYFITYLVWLTYTAILVPTTKYEVWK